MTAWRRWRRPGLVPAPSGAALAVVFVTMLAPLAATTGVAALAAVAVVAPARPGAVSATPVPPEPGGAGLAPRFTPPAAGSYRLERILQAPDGRVLDSDGSVHRLREFTTGKVTLLSLVYTYCTDAKGCPLAYATLHALKAMIAATPAWRGQVRFVSMSFDPQFDTPAMMRSYGGDDAAAGASTSWHFLTTASNRDLAPVLAGFGQDVSALDARQAGARVPVKSHLLKLYLIDQAGAVREIYSNAYLYPVMLYNDIATLMLEGRRPASH